MPVPWDATMLSDYGNLLAAMSQHFGNNPSLTLVNLGGPTRYSLEMQLPVEVASLPGFSTDRIRQAWDTVLNTYAGLFPHVRGCVNLANPFNASDGIAAQVAQDTVSILGDRASLQHDALSAQPGLPTYNIHQLIVQYGLAGTHVGFEELSASGDHRFGGSFSTAWQRVLGRKAAYLDLYTPDDQLAVPFPNQAPSFVVGADQQVPQNVGSQLVSGWATDICSGPASEAGQTLSFIVTANGNPGLFAAGPAIDPSTGNLSYTPAPGAIGTAVISLVLKDDGGTAGGGNDTSVPRTFRITVTAVAVSPWQNPLLAQDVNADGVVTPLDVLIVINTLNAEGPHALPPPVPPNVPPPYLDVNGDGYVTPLDVLVIVNYLNDQALAASQAITASDVGSSLNAVDIFGVPLAPRQGRP